MNMSRRYINDRFLPDKAIDVIDEAGSRARIRLMERPAEVNELTEQINSVRQQKEDAIRD